MVNILENSEEVEAITRENDASAIYFASQECAVCQVLWPRVERLFSEHFPAIALGRIECDRQPALAAQLGIHAVPALLVYFDGREGLRLSRNFSVADLQRQLTRPYRMMFE